MILAMNKDLPHYLERQRAGEWDTAGNTAYPPPPGPPTWRNSTS